MGKGPGIVMSNKDECVLLQSNEIPGVIAALASSPELEKIKREYEAVFMNKCRIAPSPFTREGAIAPAGLRAMLGAAEALSHAAANGEITPAQAQDELFETIIAMVDRSARGTHGVAEASRLGDQALYATP